MDARTQDRAAITDLMTGWIHRDLGEWDQRRDLFHPGATIEVTWFDGPPHGQPSRGSQVRAFSTVAGNRSIRSRIF